MPVPANGTPENFIAVTEAAPLLLLMFSAVNVFAASFSGTLAESRASARLPVMVEVESATVKPAPVAPPVSVPTDVMPVCAALSVMAGNVPVASPVWTPALAMRAAASVPLLMLLAFSAVRFAPLMAGMFASVVALPELLYAARQAQAVTYNATPVIAAGIIYLVCLWPLVRLLSRFEHKQLAVR